MDTDEVLKLVDSLLVQRLRAGDTKGENVDWLEDLAAELQERADEIRAELRAPAEPASEEEE